ncbi:MAG: homoserine dehydrogenase, partial [Ralstonia sp.]
MNPIKIGLLGLGTVGGGTLKVLQRNQEEIRRRAGRGIEVALIAVRNVEKARAIVQEAGATVPVVGDPFAVVDSPEIDIVVELIGGYDLTRELVLRAIANGKHVVTANKALLADHGEEIYRTAQENNTGIYYEAAVGGGIPILRSQRAGLIGNRIESIYGILNGTCNYILTRMEREGLPFDEILADAQALGYAETPPDLDIDGVDTAHKAVV